MSTTVTSAEVEPVPPTRPLLRRVRHSIPLGVWYTLGVIALAALFIVAQLLYHLSHNVPRDQHVIVERELQMNTLEPGERVVRMVPVFRRNGVDYFRQTRGALVLTDHRLIYLGAPPRDITGSSDAPPAFDQRVFPIDTSTKLEPTFALLGFARALRVKAPGRDLIVGVPAEAWPKAQLLRASWSGRHQKLYAIGEWAKRVRAARAELKNILDAYRKQPVYHVVRAGDAVSSIAAWYETSPDKIRELNGIVGNKIKVGQRLLIRSGGT